VTAPARAMTLGDVVTWLERAPAGTLVTTSAMLAQLRDVDTSVTMPATEPPVAGHPRSWQERLWTAPADARLSVTDVAEAFGRPKSWVYRHTSPASGLVLIPYRKLDGELVFLAGEIRQWVKDREEIMVKPSTPVVPISRPRRPNVS
jgi:hypothetical protein